MVITDTMDTVITDSTATTTERERLKLLLKPMLMLTMVILDTLITDMVIWDTLTTDTPPMFLMLTHMDTMDIPMPLLMSMLLDLILSTRGKLMLLLDTDTTDTTDMDITDTATTDIMDMVTTVTVLDTDMVIMVENLSSLRVENILL